jgi:hypothetical protein
LCNGLTLPIVVFDQVYYFDTQSLINDIPRPKGMATRRQKQFRAAAEELFTSIRQITDNAGATDAHRALNYLAVQYPAIYAKTAEQLEQNCALSAVEVQLTPLNGVRKMVDAVFSYTNRQTEVLGKFSVRVDVTDEFPFLVTKLTPYFER